MKKRRVSCGSNFFILLLFVTLTFSWSRAAELLDVDLVTTRLAAVQADESIRSDEKDRLERVLRQTLDSIQIAQSLNLSTKKNERKMQQADAEIEHLRNEREADAEKDLVEIDENNTLSELEQQLETIIADSDGLQKRLLDIESEERELTFRHTALPDLLVAAKAELQRLRNPEEIPSEESDSSMQLHEIDLWSRQAALAAAEAKVSALEMELGGFSRQKSLLSAQRDHTVWTLERSTRQKELWQQAVDIRRKQESQAAVEKADREQQEATRLPSVVRRVAEQNAALAARRTGQNGLSLKLMQVAEDLQQTKEKNISIQTRAKELKKRIDAAGLTYAVAQLLQRERDALPDPRFYQARIRQRKKEISAVQIALFDLDDQGSALRTVSARANALVGEIQPPPGDAKALSAVLAIYLESQKEQIKTLVSEYNNYFRLLVDLDTADRQLLSHVKVLSSAISEHILWVRSAEPPSLNTLRTIGALWGETRGRIVPAVTAWVQRVVANPFFLMFFVGVEAVLLVLYRLTSRRIQRITPYFVRIRTNRLVYTFELVFYTVFRALPLPLCFLYLALTSDRSLAMDAFLQTSMVVYVLMVVLESMGPNGLQETQFDGDSQILKLFRRRLRRLLVLAVPLFLGAVLFRELPDAAGFKILERLCFMALLILIMGFATNVCGKNASIVKRLVEINPTHRLLRFRRITLGLFVGIPMVMLLFSIVGYHYTAEQMAGWFAQTVGLVVMVLFFKALLMRSIWVVSRRAEFERRVSERQEQSRKNAEEPGAPLDDPVEVDEKDVDFFAISENTQQLIRVSAGFVLILGLWGIWSAAVPALGVLDRIVLWKVMNGAETMAISIENVLLSIVVFVLTLFGARHLPSFLELIFLHKLPLSFGERYAISTIARYITIGIGVGITFKTLGLHWSQIQWLVAALSVGLGFGLQEIFANFISGLIILFERPIRVRDYVTVNNTSGQVSRIQIRATTITDWDNKELLIPNKQFVTGELINWTLTNSVLRIVVPVGIAYGSDTQKAMDILTQIGRTYHMASSAHPSSASFCGFGDSSLNFELRVFIKQADQFRTATHELHMAIDNAFREAGITIAFPQLDVHMNPTT